MNDNFKLYDSKAVVRYGPGLKVFAEIDQGISNFYRSLIPKYYNVKSQRYKAHITIVRLQKENPIHLDLWGKHEGRIIHFMYEPLIQMDGKYFWINAYSEEIGQIRQELGLPKFRDDTAFGGKKHNQYHITIANTKG
jgi:hypothetical protein